MASATLFDISAIDLSQTICDSACLDQFLPQTGPMRQCDRIVWANEDYKKCVGIKDVRHDEFWVDHHIKGRPLYPGVLMIEASAQCASWQFRHRYKHLGFLGFLGAFGAFRALRVRVIVRVSSPPLPKRF